MGGWRGPSGGLRARKGAPIEGLFQVRINVRCDMPFFRAEQGQGQALFPHPPPAADCHFPFQTRFAAHPLEGLMV